MKLLFKNFILFVFIIAVVFIAGFLFVKFSGNLKKILGNTDSRNFTASIVPQSKKIINSNNTAKNKKDLEESSDDKIVINDSSQDFLDDISEELDIIDQQINLSQDDQEQIIIEDISQSEDDDKEKEELDKKENKDNYPQILISEIEVAGVSDEKQEFVELYNPNNIDVDLSDWYLQRKTLSGSSWSTYAEARLFSNKKIPSKGYFLIARNGYYLGLADIFVDNPITDDNSFALKNPNGEISDQINLPQIIKGSSCGRKWENNAENNFELQNLTPKMQNRDYVGLIYSGGGGSVIYPKILISEVKIMPIAERFVELYNPNNTDVDLTNWYLQRKDSNDISWGTFVSSANFQNKIISAGGYFLISKSLTNSDILSNITLSQDNALALKDPKEEIIDKVGFGNALDFELVATTTPTDSQSIGRKVLPDLTEQDTDNNLADFELQMPTPKAQNINYTLPILPTLENIEITTTPTKLDYFVGDPLDIGGLVLTGIYSDKSIKNEPITLDNITGFDSTTPTTGQVLTISFNGKSTNYSVNILEKPISPPPAPILPSIVIYTISNSIISTTSPTTTIDLAFSEKVKANVDILDSSGNKVKDLYYSSGVTNPDPKIWDGKDNSGTIVPDGIYTIKVLISDVLGNSFADTSQTIIASNNIAPS